ncbi:MAG: NUDIX domain-containing protein [Candidatus Micrarchaeales archaeon]
MRKQSKESQNKHSITKKQVSAGAIVFMIHKKEINVLQLIYKKEGKEEIDIGPKGHVEKGESLLKTANREIMEELGIPLHIDGNFREEETYSFLINDERTKAQRKINKKAVFFLAFINQKDIRQINLSNEHTRYYLTPIDKAIEQVAFPNQRFILEKAREYIKEHYLT